MGHLDREGSHIYIGAMHGLPASSRLCETHKGCIKPLERTLAFPAYVKASACLSAAVNSMIYGDGFRPLIIRVR